METSDRNLLDEFISRGDEQALSQLVRRYAGLVYSASMRILGDPDLAADAVQETFLDLTGNAHKVTGSLGGWLHRVATRRSLDLVRQRTARRRREEAYVAEMTLCAESAWVETSAEVDRALLEIPDSLRELVVLYFMEQKSMTHIAARHGLSQPTVSRRIAEGLQHLRARLAARGIGVGTVPLQGLLLHTRWEVPEALLGRLGDLHVPLATAAAAGAAAHFSWLAVSKWAAAGAAASALAWAASTWVETAPTIASLPAPQPALRKTPENPPEPAETVHMASAEATKSGSSAGPQPEVRKTATGLRSQAFSVPAVPAWSNSVPHVPKPPPVLRPTNTAAPVRAAAPAPRQERPVIAYPLNVGNQMRLERPARTAVAFSDQTKLMITNAVQRKWQAFNAAATRNRNLVSSRQYLSPASTVARDKRGAKALWSQ